MSIAAYGNINTARRIDELKLSDTQVAELLHRSMRGAGTDEELAWHILETSDPEQLKRVISKHDELYGNSDGTLKDRIWWEFSGQDYRRAMQGYNRAAGEFTNINAAENLNDAMWGVGVDKSAVFNTLANVKPADWETVKTKFKELYGSDVETALKSELGETSAAFLRAMEEVKRLENKQTLTKEEKTELAGKVAFAINYSMKGGTGFSYDTEEIQNSFYVLSHLPQDQKDEMLNLVLRSYETKYGSFTKAESEELSFEDSTLLKHLKEELENGDLDRIQRRVHGFKPDETAKALLEAFNYGEWTALWLAGTDDQRVWTNMLDLNPDEANQVRNSFLSLEGANGKPIEYWAGWDLDHNKSNNELAVFNSLVNPELDLSRANIISDDYGTYWDTQVAISLDQAKTVFEGPDRIPLSPDKAKEIATNWEEVYGKRVWENWTFNEMLDYGSASEHAESLRGFFTEEARNKYLEANPEIAVKLRQAEEAEHARLEAVRKTQPDYIAEQAALAAINQWNSVPELSIINKLTYEEAYIASGNAWQGASGTAEHSEYQGQCFKYFVIRVNQLANEEGAPVLDLSTNPGLEQAQQAYQQFKKIHQLNHEYYKLSGQSRLYLRDSSSNVPSQEPRDINATWNTAQRNFLSVSNQASGLSISGKYNLQKAQALTNQAQSLIDNWDSNLYPKEIIQLLALPQAQTAAGLNPNYPDSAHNFKYLIGLLTNPETQKLAPNFNYSSIDPKTPAGRANAIKLYLALGELAKANTELYNYTGQVRGLESDVQTGIPKSLDIRIDGDMSYGIDRYSRILNNTIRTEIRLAEDARK